VTPMELLTRTELLGCFPAHSALLRQIEGAGEDYFDLERRPRLFRRVDQSLITCRQFWHSYAIKPGSPAMGAIDTTSFITPPQRGQDLDCKFPRCEIFAMVTDPIAPGVLVRRLMC
jgi:hypothetical protein